MNNIPLSLYIHFPWCVKKCPYCDFNSHAFDADFPEEAYIQALIQDLDSQRKKTSRRQLTSIFMGGGTPSLFSSESISSLLQAIESRFDLSTTEITLEANPGTFDAAQFEGYRKAGVNRISIGVQSFNNRHLKSLGRIHNNSDAEQAYKGAIDAGFTRINLDLMYGLPGQSIEEAAADLATAISLGPEHISWYQLTIEPNTVFYRRPPDVPDADVVTEIMDQGLELMMSHGYRRYEISAYAKPGHEARHNLNYWLFGDYLGIGAGAHGKQTHQGTILRTTKSRVPADYLKDPVKTLSSAVPRDQILTEFLMNSLRLSDGFDIELFTIRTGLRTEILDDFLARSISRGLIEVNGKIIHPTTRGLDFLNETLLLIDS